MGYSEGQGSLVCCIPWGHRVRQDLVTEQHTIDDEETAKVYSFGRSLDSAGFFLNLHLCGNCVSPITVNVLEYC